MATNKGTGPMSKNAVSGGTQFPIQTKDGTIGSQATMNNSAEGAHRTIMGMRYASTDFVSHTAAEALKAKKSTGTA